ncbi:MAG: hypothetical protein QOJ65_2596 [Fimbriimonadaceae bacterium]|jgi:uncharacterized CHY-type Zn-finger protein|nr:hypothetical protein [Fimbriimonadaceae bacterium]
MLVRRSKLCSNAAMANCFRCGQHIDSHRHLRRRVKTGEWVRHRHPNKRVSISQTHYGMRVVCPWCAKALDRTEARRELAIWIELAAALILLLALLTLG